VVEKELLKSILNDFSDVIENKQILGILLFGSYANDQETNRSDIDICIVAPNEKSNVLLSYIWQKVNVYSKKYDVRVFSELPLYIKIEVIRNGVLLYSPDRFDLYEYFYLYRKLWADQKHRQNISKKEILTFLK
jgi:hypothetical protein